jgi:hypothetical protein
MADTNVTFEDIDKHINALHLADFQAGGKSHFNAAAVSANPADVLKKVCEVYRGIRPILIALESFPLLPKKWRDALKTFTNLMDTLCPGS